MTENTAERATAVSDLADHLENDLLPCPAGRAVLLGWLEKQLAHLARNPVPSAADATWPN
ncbi:hypothetical protein LU674_032335 [Pseudomonas alloputida]|uniref:Uncharacterized protein n=3 Tax=Pseudomonas TaxID=286 RepID=A0A7X2C5V6_9PSED|nr:MULTISPECIES: hypothetical protein [Pseudomonas]MCQ9186505.1 hypothetical protein [Streptomyces hayashii]ELQ8318191.1 hypothetical protein [Pseudomonas aeruginosa]MCV4224775.1 hypothetical protein [Pseudomonas aeruginosa]MDM3956955.1 hypothetical protein [Pseudomonas alloputida]MQT91953.1 hypothetical protein [Pseudomonas helleri]